MVYILRQYKYDISGYEFYILGVFDSEDKAKLYVNCIEKKEVKFKYNRSDIDGYIFYEIIKTRINKRIKK